MRAWAFAIVAALAGCVLPEDRFLLEGTVVNTPASGPAQPLPGVEVRLLRDTSRDGMRCVPMRPVAATTTDEGGGYRFELIRQQLTAGATANRAFRVEVGSSPVSSYTVRFPEVDLRLPPLPLSGSTSVVGFEDEHFVDGQLAWRGNQFVANITEGREAQSRSVLRVPGTLTLTVDSLGGTAEHGYEWRVEAPLTGTSVAGVAPASRNAPCDLGPPSGPCPVTDGRFLPWVGAGVPSVTLTLDDNRSLGIVLLHGLVLSGNAATAWLDAAFDDVGELVAVSRAVMGADAQQRARLSCDEPGVFVVLRPSLKFPRAKRVRLRFLDADERALDILSLSEVSLYEAF